MGNSKKTTSVSICVIYWRCWNHDLLTLTLQANILENYIYNTYKPKDHCHFLSNYLILSYATPMAIYKTPLLQTPSKTRKLNVVSLFPAQSLTFQSFPIYTQLYSLKKIPTLRLNRTENELTSFPAPATVSFSPLNYICLLKI